ncbi:fungal-specific transcription factor domain-containing protein [Xylogone sp. PMI_703]|nr:fungal-specific transcription factor domain-containing protein [Xylogone sp. PMI_703]
MSILDSGLVEDALESFANFEDSAGPSLPIGGSNASKSGASEKPEKIISCINCRKRKLKCNRVKPACTTCLRAGLSCEYPERKKIAGSRRRNMRELEARLAQVETKLVAEVNRVKSLATRSASETPQVQALADSDDVFMDFELGSNDDINISNLPDEPAQSVPNIHAHGPTHPSPDSCQELISLGAEEPLPPPELFEELTQLYFEQCHLLVPIIHKNRYLDALKLTPSKRPPICLQYAVLASAATLSDRYSNYHNIFYERSRKYLEKAEMSGSGELYTSVHYVQTWVLIANYEAKHAYFTRAWMSTGRCTRLSQMLGLYNLDSNYPNNKTVIAPAVDCIEKEERRRAFWAAFHGDRWASSGTGWPMTIDESMIQTNLPSSEMAFEAGIEEKTPSLQEALTPKGASRLSPFAAVILSACLFGHNFQHLQTTGPNEHPEDLVRGEFWKRHKRIDNVLSSTFMFLPEHLRLPQGIRDMNVVFVNMNIHTSTICLHQAAILTAQKYSLDSKFIRQCQRRNLMAAEEVTNIMRLVSHMNPAIIPPWICFCLYVAVGVFLQDQITTHNRPQSSSNADFLLSAMKAMSKNHKIAQQFIIQLEFDLEASGIHLKNHAKKCTAPKPWMRIHRGVLPEGFVIPETLYSQKPKHTSGSIPVGDSSDSTSSSQTPQLVISEHHRNIDPYIAGATPNTLPSPLNLQDRLFATTFNLPIPSISNFNTESLDTSVYDVTNDGEIPNTKTPREYSYDRLATNSHDHGTADQYGAFQHNESICIADIGRLPVTPGQGDMVRSTSADISLNFNGDDITSLLEQTGWPGNNIGGN